MTFLGHRVVMKADGAEPTVLLIKSLSCMAALSGAPEQPFSAEMQRWDDYRVAANINDGTQSMVALFCPGGKWTPPFQGHTSGASNTVMMSITAKPELEGAPCQDLTPEMLRYDDYAELGLAPKLPSTLQATFFKEPPFAGHTVEVLTPSGERTQSLIMCITATAAKCGAEVQNFTPEMLRWDDVRAAGAPDGQATLRSVWGA